MQDNKQKNTTGIEQNPERKERKEDNNTNFPKSPTPESEKGNKNLQHDQDR